MTTVLTLTCNSTKLLPQGQVLVQLVDPDVPAPERQDSSRIYVKVPIDKAGAWVPGKKYDVTIQVAG